jgi:uncharacterized membrane protein
MRVKKKQKIKKKIFKEKSLISEFILCLLFRYLFLTITSNINIIKIYIPLSSLTFRLIKTKNTSKLSKL